MDLYELARGPLAWGALIIFALGCIYRVASLLLSPAAPFKAREPAPSGAIRASVISWLVPFGNHSSRAHPVLTLVSFSFHVLILLTPILLLGHNVLWYESWKVEVWSLPEVVADGLTVAVIAACGFFAARRLMVAEVRAVSRASDYLLLLMVALPFVSGFLAFHGWGPYRPMLIVHILSGELLLVAIPFTRLRHMLTFTFARADVGAELGDAVRPGQW